MMKPNDKDQKCKGGIAPLWLQPLLWATAAVRLLLTCLLCFSGSRQIKHKKTEKTYPHTGMKRKRKNLVPLTPYPTTSTNQLSSEQLKRKRERETKIILLPQRHIPQSRQGGPYCFCTLGELRLALHAIQRPAPSNALTYALFLAFACILVVALQCHIEH